MKLFKAILLTIESPNTVSGKNTTIKRLVHGLERMGVTAEAVSTHGLSRPDLAREIGRRKPDLIHAFHAYKAGRDGVWLGRRLSVPVVITISGTDINLDLHHPNKSRDTLAALNKADFVVVANDYYKSRLKEDYQLATEVAVVAKSALLPDGKIYFTRKELSLAEQDQVFLFPAGIRRVKNNLFPLEPLAELQKVHPGVKLICLGLALETDYAGRFLSRIERYDWARYEKEVEPRTMSSWYNLADVVLNCSHSEGCSNVILEAQNLGKTVLGSNIPGNRDVVVFGEENWGNSTGVLYRVQPRQHDPASYDHDAEDFYRKAKLLLEKAELRAAIGANAQKEMETKHRLEGEIDGYLRVYRQLLGI